MRMRTSQVCDDNEANTKSHIFLLLVSTLQHPSRQFVSMFCCVLYHYQQDLETSEKTESRTILSVLCDRNKRIFEKKGYFILTIDRVNIPT